MPTPHANRTPDADDSTPDPAGLMSAQTALQWAINFRRALTQDGNDTIPAKSARNVANRLEQIAAQITKEENANAPS